MKTPLVKNELFDYNTEKYAPTRKEQILIDAKRELLYHVRTSKNANPAMAGKLESVKQRILTHLLDTNR